MFDELLGFLSTHPMLGALVYSWGCFEIGRTLFKVGRRTGAFLWEWLAILTAIIYFFVAAADRQPLAATLLAVTAGSQVWLQRRQLRSDSKSANMGG